jgi:hypothetical protein
MPSPTILSPNTGNYQVGKGIVSFKKEGSAVFRDLGDVESMAINPSMKTLDHFSSRTGVKSKDRSIVLEKAAAVKIVMSEITADNLALMFLGTVDDSAVGGPTVEVFDQDAVSGWLRFVGTNEVGAQLTMDLYNVSFTPSGNFDLISTEWNKMEATADILVSNAAIAASDKLTSTAIADGDTVTVGGVTYTFETTLTAVANHVHRTGTLATDLANLVKAINLTGVSGTDYGAGTVINPNVSAVSDATTLTATAKVAGPAGNAIVATEVGAGTSWATATLKGGVAAGKFGIVQFTNVPPAP